MSAIFYSQNLLLIFPIKIVTTNAEQSYFKYSEGNTMRERVYVSSLSKRAREKLREDIVAFCGEPRTHREVAEQFNLSGISASNVLSRLCDSVLSDVDGRYVKRE